MRLAIATFLSAVSAIPSSSMVKAITAAAKRLAVGKTLEVRFSPSSKLIELTMALPGMRLSASSTTSASVESTKIGAGGAYFSAQQHCPRFLNGYLNCDRQTLFRLLHSGEYTNNSVSGYWYP